MYKCPFCKSKRVKVTDSRPAQRGQSCRRRRECKDCAKRFTTYERIEEESPGFEFTGNVGCGLATAEIVPCEINVLNLDPTPEN